MGTKYNAKDLKLAARRARGNADEERRSARQRLVDYYATADDPVEIRKRRQAGRNGGS